MSNRIGVLVAVVGLMGVMAPSAQATPISGGISVTMSYVPVCGASDCLTLGTATGLDFNNGGVVGTPGVTGNEVVTSSNGDVSFPIGTIGQIKDFSFTGAGAPPNFPTATILAWETIGGLTFDLSSVSVTLQNASDLVLNGTGTFHLAGFDATPGAFSLSANAAGNTFSASASKNAVPAAVPEPASMLLFGTGLVALGRTARRRFRKSA